MATATNEVEALIERGYEHGFFTDIESDTVAPGLDEDVIRLISKQEERAGLHARLAPARLPALARR